MPTSLPVAMAAISQALNTAPNAPGFFWQSWPLSQPRPLLRLSHSSSSSTQYFSSLYTVIEIPKTSDFFTFLGKQAVVPVHSSLLAQVCSGNALQIQYVWKSKTNNPPLPFILTFSSWSVHVHASVWPLPRLYALHDLAASAGFEVVTAGALVVFASARATHSKQAALSFLLSPRHSKIEANAKMLLGFFFRQTSFSAHPFPALRKSHSSASSRQYLSPKSDTRENPKTLICRGKQDSSALHSVSALHVVGGS